jgi:hypothetical protein
MLSIYLMIMNTSCISYPDTDLVWLHYITFIELIAISPDEALSYDSKQFMNTYMNKLIEAKSKEPFLLFKEISL